MYKTVAIGIALWFSLTSCSSDLTKGAATELIKTELSKISSSEELYFQLPRSQLENCISLLRSKGATPFILDGLKMATLTNSSYILAIPVKAEFKDVTGIQIVSDAERQVEFSYRLTQQPHRTASGTATYAPQEIYVLAYCMPRSRILHQFAPGSTGTVESRAVFKKYSDGWRFAGFLVPQVNVPVDGNMVLPSDYGL